MLTTRKTVVAIDASVDDAFRLDCLLNALSRPDHKFCHYSRPEQAIEAGLAGDCELLFVASSLGESGLLETIRLLRRREFLGAIVALLSHDAGSLALQTLRAGADDCVFREQLDIATLTACLQQVDACCQRRLNAAAQQTLLAKTLVASVLTLTELLSRLRPQAFIRGWRARQLVRLVVQDFDAVQDWELEVAAVLSQVGCLEIPEELVRTVQRNSPLSHLEAEVFFRHPEIGARLIGQIPRLESVAQIILHQEHRFDGQGHRRGQASGQGIPLGARILKVALDLQAMATSGRFEAGLRLMSKRTGWYDPHVLGVFEKRLLQDGDLPRLEARPSDLELLPGAHGCVAGPRLRADARQGVSPLERDNLLAAFELPPTRS